MITKFDYGTEKQHKVVKWIEKVLEIEYVGINYNQLSDFITQHITEAKKVQSEINQINMLDNMLDCDEWRDPYGDNL